MNQEDTNDAIILNFDSHWSNTTSKDAINVTIVASFASLVCHAIPIPLLLSLLRIVVLPDFFSC
jgi:hypothetical protein